MDFQKKLYKKVKPIHIIIFIYFIGNLFILTHFPFVHSDEAWLSGLTRQILAQKNLQVTEPFFDLYPRHPHAIKIFFHFIQIIFLKFLDYNIFTFRLISLISSTFILYIFHRLIRLFTDSKILNTAGVILLAVDIHFIYSSHLARQEIILVLILLSTSYYYLSCKHWPSLSENTVSKHTFKNPKNFSSPDLHSSTNLKHDFLLALILGGSIGIHPNSFIISLPFILLYTYNLLFSRGTGWKNYLVFGITLASLGLYFIIFSFNLDPAFISHYSSYGSRLGVLSSLSTKLDRWLSFYKKIYYRISGTYYIPPVKFQIIIFCLGFFTSLIKLLYNQSFKNFFLIMSVIGINLGYILIGRYNQTSIIFLFPICYLLIINLLSSIKLKYAYFLILCLILILSINTGDTLVNDTHYNYDDYLNNIAKVVKPQDKVLANLNTQYYFERGNLFDYRNLAYLAQHNLTFSDYIKKNEIQFIIYPEEMDFIYNTRPVWNILYGNPYPYYNQMKTYLNENCEMVSKFTNKTYGMRIVRYIGSKNWQIKIYKVK